MSLRLVLENAPHAQAVMEKEYGGGRMVIGRSDEADWQLVDPDMFVSRSHAVITEEAGRIMVTDASSGGLYIDNAANPVGTGNAVPLEPGMRLRLGDFVLRVEEVTVRASVGQQPPPRSGAGVFSFEFGAPEAAEPPPERPKTLPDPFGLRSDDRAAEREREVVRPPRPLDQEDPFELDLRGAQPDPDPAPSGDSRGGGGFGGYFGDAKAPEPEPEDDIWSPKISTPSPDPAPRERVRGAETTPEPDTGSREEPVRDPFGLMGDPEPRDGGLETHPTPEPEIRAEPEPDPAPEPPRAPEPVAEPLAIDPVPEPPSPPRPAPVQTAAPADDSALREAFFRGLGVDPSRLPPGNSAEEMERAGRCMRGLVEGVMALLRTRAEEKSRVRVAQTIIASANVNPLKFLATTEDGLASLLQPRGEGYLAPEDAVNWAFRDLNDHQVRTWTALQAALRRMIDSFDPKEIEKEMADAGLLEKLLAGGSSAKKWDLYEERYREIARSAEERFLGEVGADFRDAYENQGRS